MTKDHVSSELRTKASRETASDASSTLTTQTDTISYTGEVTTFSSIQYTAIVEKVDTALLPEGCFQGIEDGCRDADTSEYSCSYTDVSEELAYQAAEDLGFGVVSFLQDLNNPSQPKINSLVSHNSTCQDGTETLWSEIIQIASDYGNIVFEINPNSYSASFLSLFPNSFGIGSVCLLCFRRERY